MTRKILITGAAGFIGRNLLEYFLQGSQYEVYAVYNRVLPPENLKTHSRARLIKADLTNPIDVDRVCRGMDVIIQAAATTSGAKDIVTKPYIHVADNAVMNSLLLRAAHDHKVGQVIFFSCTVMYPKKENPVREEDFNHQISKKYFGVGWTKVYIEKMCEFYSSIGETKYTAIRHSNIYGPYDKYDLEKSHVFGATVTKVMTAKDGKIVVWGDGTEERDLLYVEDLVRFVEKVVAGQQNKFDLVNVGLGKSIAVTDLVQKIIQYSGRDIKIEYDRSKPTLPFKLAVNIEKAKALYGWEPRVTLDEGIQKSLDWYRQHVRKEIIHAA